MNRTSLPLSLLALLASTPLVAACVSVPADAGDPPSDVASPVGSGDNLPMQPVPAAEVTPFPDAGHGGDAQPGPTGPGPADSAPADAADLAPNPSGEPGGDAGMSSDASAVADSGSASDAGSGHDSGPAPLRSGGCGTAAEGQLGSWTTRSVSLDAGDRNYDIRLPQSYTEGTAHPAILLLHGCGSPLNNVPMEGVAGDAAIVVRGTGTKNGCWHETASGADLPYLDAVLEDVESRFCVDTAHWFAVGYSSGSWLASTLSCHRGDQFRGIASVAGGEPAEISGCAGQHGRIFLHDTADTNNRIEWDVPARDRMLQTNHCGVNTLPFDPSPCIEYQDCDPGYPVVWCETSGQGHNRQDNLAPQAFWTFFQQLMRH